MGTLVVEGSQLEGCRVLAHLHRRKHSEICVAEDPQTHQLFAIKHVLCKDDSHAVERALNEYEIGRQLSHPNIRRVFRLVKRRRLFWLDEVSEILELIDAPGLDEKKPESQADAVCIFRQIASALDYMHGRGFVHNNIKPCNILVEDDLTVHIIDLGKACRIGATMSRVHGTPGYMAPEQAHCHPLTPQTDMYNLGATMYAVLCDAHIPTASAPVRGDRLKTKYRCVMEEHRIPLPKPPHERNPEIHHILSKLIMDCIHPIPETRPASMSDVALRLELIETLLRKPLHDTDGFDAQFDDEDEEAEIRA